jgi:hypothetical protein
MRRRDSDPFRGREPPYALICQRGMCFPWDQETHRRVVAVLLGGCPFELPGQGAAPITLINGETLIDFL